MAIIDGANYSLVEKHYVERKLSNVLKLMTQKSVSKLEACVLSEGGLRGETVSPCNLMGEFQSKERQGRYEETPIMDIDRDRRWYRPTMRHGAVLFDSWDAIRMDLNPKDGTMKAILADYNRHKDSIIEAAILGNALTGPKAEVSTPMLDSMVVAAGVGGGDILKKINRARTLFTKNHVDIENEEIIMLVPSSVEEELLASGIYVNNDYMDNKPLNGKSLPGYAGVRFVRYEVAAKGGKILCPVFCKSAMALGKWEEFKVKIAERADLSHNEQIYVEYALGATRTDEKKVAAIEVAASSDDTGNSGSGTGGNGGLTLEDTDGDGE